MPITKRSDNFRLEVMLDEKEVRLHSATIVEEGGEELVRKQHPPKIVPLEAVRAQVMVLVKAVKDYVAPLEKKPKSMTVDENNAPATKTRAKRRVKSK